MRDGVVKPRNPRQGPNNTRRETNVQVKNQRVEAKVKAEGKDRRKITYLRKVRIAWTGTQCNVSGGGE